MIVFFDQIEECYTLPCVTAPDELSEFIASIKGLPYRLVLSFRKEWFPEIQKQVEEAGIDYSKVFLEALDHDAILEVVNGLRQTQRLREFYNLTIDSELPETIAHEMMADRGSPIAPTLQILLTKMWRNAVAVNAHAPKLTAELHRRLQAEGLLLGDFLDQQLDELSKTQGPAVESGLALDVLTYHTTALATAQQRLQAELLTTYAHCAAQIPALVQEMVRLFLLSDSSADSGEKATRLTHDTLAPVVRQRFDHSNKIGQHARRIIEGRTGDWDETDENALDGPSLAVVARGAEGMRALNPREQALLAASQRKHAKETRVSRILKIAAAFVAVVIIALSIGFGTAYYHAKRQQFLVNLQANAVLVQTRLPNQPRNSLIFAIATVAAAADSLQSQGKIPSVVQFALSSAMVEATEADDIHGTGLTGAAATPDGSIVAASSATLKPNIDPKYPPFPSDLGGGGVNLWGRQGVAAPSPPLLSFGHEMPLAFRSPGDLLAIGGASLSVWDLHRKALSNKDLFGGSEPDREVASLSFTPLGEYLLSYEGDGRLRVWTLDGHEVTSVHAGGHSASAAKAISTTRGMRGETLVATGGEDGYVRLWRLEGEKLSPAYPEKEFKTGAPVTCVAIRVRDNRMWVVAGDGGGVVRLWTTNGAASHPLTGQVTAIAIHPDLDIVAAAAAGGVIRFFDSRGVDIAPAFRGSQERVAVLQFLGDGSHLLAAGEGIRFLDTTLLGGSRRITAFDSLLSELGGSITGAAFLRGGSVVAGTGKGDVLLWDRKTGTARRAGHASGKGLRNLAANRQGTIIAGEGDGGRIELFDANIKNLGWLPPPAGTNKPFHLVFSPDGRTLAADYPNDNIVLWNMATREQRARLKIARSAAPDGSADKGIFSLEWDVVGHNMAFTADSRRLAVVWPHHPGLRLWNMEGEFPSEVLKGVPDDVTALAFRRDGNGFVTGHPGGGVIMWTMDGKPGEQEMHPSKGNVLWIATDADSERMFLADDYGVRVATYPALNSNQENIASFNLPSQIASASLSMEEDEIVTVDGSGVARIWPAHWRAFLREDCERLRDHPVFRSRDYAEGLTDAVIKSARVFCAEQVWKK